MLFKSVIGQAELKRRFIREIQNGKLAHAQLFSGEPGYGTLSLCLAYIQYLFCSNRQEDDSCGTCSSCLKMAELQHPDVHFSFPVVQTISKTCSPLLNDWRAFIKAQPFADLPAWVEQMDPKMRHPMISSEGSKEIIQKLTLKSYEGGYKVMVIWMAEEMGVDCANKLLKILEEPPAKTIFFLITEQKDRLLATIQSRTQAIVVPPIDHSVLCEFVENHFSIAPSEATTICGRAQGNLLSVVHIVDADENTQHYRDWFIQLMRVCYKKDVLEMLQWADELSGQGKERQKQFLTYALHMFRQSLLRNYTDQTLVHASEEELAFLKNFSRFITGNNIFDLHQSFNDFHYHIDRNANARILFTNLTFQVMRSLWAA
jgi:DNA polymerase-3 subunit delta'